MNTKSRIIALILALTLVLAVVFAITAAANDSTEEKTTVNAEIMAAPNGATAIASMTFDDGKYNTAVLLNSLFQEYGLKGSLMISGSLGGKTADQWNELFDDGYLVPESHSMGHKNLGSGQADDALTIEEKRAEIGGSYDFLREKFPDYDILAYAIPNSNYDAKELGLVNEKFYSARTGNCVLYHSSYNGKMQSLDPTFDNKVGSWMNTYMVRMQSNVGVYASTNSTANIIKYLDQCVENGGWFISMSHGVSTADGTPEITEAQLREILAAMQQYVEDGKLWVTSMSEATKYIRERQNSSLTAYEQGGKYYVNVSMATETDDGLPLTADVFNMPLTVKLEVPTHWTMASCTVNGKTETVRVRGNVAGKYIYVNVVPNSGTVEVTDATPAEDKHIAGSYTQPDGTWTPEEGSDIKFAEWSSEASFLAGDKPIATYTTNVLTHENVGLPRGDYSVKSNYVHLFADCTTNTAAQLYIGLKQSIVINLGGYKLDCPNGILVGDASGSRTQAKLTIKNGTFNHKGGNVQCRGESELRYDNVAYNVGGACMNYDDVARLIEFKNSTLNITGAAYFSIGTRSGWSTCQLNFINTDVITTAANPYLFRINLSDASTSPAVIRFDKDSSIIRNSDNPLVVVNKGYNPDIDVPINTKVPHYLIFEEGCVISESIAPVYGEGYTYRVQHYNQSSGKYGPTGSKTADSEYITSFDGGFSDGTIFVKVVKPGTDEMIKWKCISIDDGMFVLEKAPSNAWEPTAEYAGITYGLWESETDFLSGKAPVKWSTKTTFNNTDLGIDTNGANISGAPVVGYMRFYADLTSAFEDASVSAKKLQIITPAARSLVMDLNGFTYFDAVGIRPGGSSGTHPKASFTIKNGRFERNGGQFQIRQDVKVTFDKVLIVNNLSNFFYGCAPDLLKFKDCTFYNLTGYGFHMGNPYTTQGSSVAEIIFENTDIIYFVAPTQAMFQFSDSAYGDGIYDVVFDQNSSINLDFSTFTLAQLSETYQYPQDVVHNNMKIRIIIEDGFTVPKGASLSYNCTYITVDKEASKVASDEATAANKAAGKTDNVTKTVTLAPVTLESSTAADSKFSWLVYAPGDRTKGSYDYYSIADNTGYYTATDRIVANLGSLYQCAEFDKEGNLIKTWPIGYNFVFDTVTAIVNTNGSTIKFFHDTEFNKAGTYNTYNITFDLNGCTLKFTGSDRFQLGVGCSASWMERNVSFIDSNPDKRGTLDFTNWTGYNSPIQNRPGSIIVFRDIDIKTTTGLILEYGAKSITFVNVNFINSAKNKAAQSVIQGGLGGPLKDYLAKEGSVREFVIDNCVFDTGIYFSTWSDNSTYGDKLKVTVKGETLLYNTGRCPFVISGNGTAKADFNIAEGVKLTSIASKIVDSGNYVAVVTGADIKSLEILEDGYRIASKPANMQNSDLQVNLTLYTDFQLNFFAKDNITGITANGVALESIEYQGLDKYTISDITPNVAADDIQLLVYVVDGDKNYVLPLSYSILKYSEQVVAKSDDEYAKKLVSAAMDYVKAAYVYTKKDAPKFDGVAYKSFTAEAEKPVMPSAIKSAQLDLDYSFKLRFNIKEGYTGDIVVNGVTYKVENGVSCGLTYIEVEMRAYALFGTAVTITADGATGEYSLANYVVFANGEGGTLADLANALYNYAAYANIYKNNK